MHIFDSNTWDDQKIEIHVCLLMVPRFWRDYNLNANGWQQNADTIYNKMSVI